MRRIIAFFVLTILLGSGSALADAIGNAYGICDRMEKLSFVTECKVEVHSEANSINLTIDMSAREAQKTCVGIAPKLSAYFRTASRWWLLRIYSPYSGNHPIARCSLN